MRGFAIATLAVLTAACGSNTLSVGERTVSFTTPASPDTLLARAEAALLQLGFAVGGRQENVLFTAPRALPDSIAGSPAGTPQQWFVHVTAEDKLFSAGTTGTIRAYLVPVTAMPSPGTSAMESAHQVTSRRPAAFRELRRVGERVQAEATRGFLR